ncbi:MAG: AMP-binding protein [Pseudomonadota bacterium]|nr:AMP-binding protein [Pseudomonadota bacterium]
MSRTVIQVFEETAARCGDLPALKTKVNGVWQATSWAQYRRNVRKTARALMGAGIAPGDGFALLAGNSEHWVTAYLASIAAGGVPAGLYVTSSPEQCAFVIDHCDASMVLVDSEEQLAKVLAVRDQLPKLKTIILTEGESDAPDVLTWGALQTCADQVAEDALQARIDALKPDDLATLIYTSGTTGNPKGVMMTHTNLTFTGETARETVGIQRGHEVISYLPLCHIAEQNITLHVSLASGQTVWFAESLDALGENLKEVRPHFFVAVPRVWEKIQAKLEAGMAEATGVKKHLLHWARGVGARSAEADQAGRRRPLLYPLADKLIFSKLRAALGLDRCFYAMTGAAPISQGTMDFFASLGITILEVYGQSESTGGGTLSKPGANRKGSIGRALPGTEVSIAEDGEILLRGPHVSPGYFKNPEATAETMDADGWLHTGDVGRMDDEGFVYITDRKKELIITAGGENISPQMLEGRLASIPGVSQVAVIGDRRKYITALFTLNPETLPGALQAAGSPARHPQEAANCPVFVRWFESQVERANEDFARVQTIKKFTLLDEDFSVEGGELTPTMKKKRRIIAEKYASQIEAMYAS